MEEDLNIVLLVLTKNNRSESLDGGGGVWTYQSSVKCKVKL